MKVKLLQKIEASEQVWEKIRGDWVPFDELATMDLPVSSFNTYVFYIESSILFRDLVCTIRPGKIWAKTNRVIKHEKGSLTFADDELISFSTTKNKEGFEPIYNEIYEGIHNGVPADVLRYKLPLMTVTSWCWIVDYNTLCDTLYTLEENNKAFTYTKKLLFLEAAGISEYTYENTKKSDLFSILSIKEEHLNHLGEQIEETAYILGKRNLPAAICGQFIRQSNTPVRYSLWNEVRYNYDNVCQKNSGDLFSVVSVNSKQSIDGLIRKRSCWFAQFEQDNSWGDILEPFLLGVSPIDFLKRLPCSGIDRKCVYRKEMERRETDRDRNLKCPILSGELDRIEKRFNTNLYNTNNNLLIVKLWKRIKPLLLLKTK
jgi:hypothetical protein